MKFTRFTGLLIALVSLTTAAAVMQNPDPAANVIPFGSVVAGIGVNAARTGAAVDRQGYAGAMVLVAQGHVVNAATSIVYWVLQDSSVTPAQVWTAVDSILADTVDNKGFGLSYRKSARFLRVIQRATSSANDTTISGALILLTGKRSK